VLRLFAFSLFLSSLAWMALNFSREITGSATEYRIRNPLPARVYTRTEDPVIFRNLMITYWILSTLPALAGWIFLGIYRSEQRADPFRTDLKD